MPRRPAAAAVVTASGVSIGAVNGTFYPNPGNAGPFNTSQLSQPAFSQVFPSLYFNPFPQHFTVACSNDPGVMTETRPFTDVVQNADGSCGTIAAQGNGKQAGVGTLFNFEATFTTEMTVASAGPLTFTLYVDDGWIFGAGKQIGGTAQPTYVSGLLQNPPPSSPLMGYPVVGAWNTTSHGGNVQVTVNFPAAGTYPIELDYTECCGGGLSLLLMTSNLGPIQQPGAYAPVPQTFGPADGSLAENPTAFLGEPVNTASGNFYTEAVDAGLSGIGVPFVYSRSYNSADVTVGRLGRGWTDSLAWSLRVLANGDVIVRAATGQQLHFAKQGTAFRADAGGRATLTAAGTGYELVSFEQIHYSFDANGRLTKEVDRNGKGLTLSYDAGGDLTSATDSVGRAIAFTITAGRLTAVTLPDGRSLRYDYTGGLLTSATDLRGGVTRYGYDAGGRLASITDQNNHSVVQNTYDANTGRVTQQVDARGNPSSFAWDQPTQTATYTDPRGKVWKDVYTSNVLQERIDPLGQAASYDYDADDNVTGVTDPRGNKIAMTYDSRGNLLTRTAPAPLSYGETFTYNAQNDPLTDKDGRGNTTAYGYDNAGNRTTIAEPDPDGPGPLGPPTTTLGRDPAGSGLLTSVTDPRGKTTVLDYDAFGNLISATSPLGEKATMGYDGSGRMTSRVDPRGNVAGADPALFKTVFSYDDADHLLTQTDPLGNLTKWGYDAVGNLASVTDAKNRATNYSYDAANELTSVTATDQSVTRRSYDPNGNLASRTDANQHVTTYAYDDANRVISVTAALARTWKFAYDPNGNRTSVVDANGNATATAGDGTTTLGYDVLNRQTSIGYSDTTPAVSYSYDANDNRTQMTDGAGSVVYAYDPLDRLTSLTRGASSFAYEYDATSNLTQETYPDGTIIGYGYDDDERLLSATSAGQATTYAYDAASHLATTTLPAGNGYVETRIYDRAGRLTNVKNAKGTTVLSAFAYTLDPVGNPTTMATSGATTGTTTYSYDPRDRLTSVCFQASCPRNNDPYIRWTYDKVGSRLSEARSSGTTTYTYNAADELTAAGATSYGYDQNGNETAAGTRSYTYDLANRLTSTTSGTTTTTYSYDGDGLRQQASTGSLAANKTNYTWDVNRTIPQLVGEQDGTGASLRRYLYGLHRISMRAGTADFYYHYDGLGSVTNLTSASGATQWTYIYEPFGTIRTETKGKQTTPPTNLMRFSGELFDQTGLYHLRARQYDPTSGRFTTPDPLGAAAGSTYAYVDDRPTIFVDPTGQLLGLPSPGDVIGAAWDETKEVASDAWGTTKDVASGAWGATTGAASWAWRNIACISINTVANTFAIGVGGLAITGGVVLAGACIRFLGLHAIHCAPIVSGLWLAGGLLIYGGVHNLRESR
jgi:RHS repeat-associated protein